MQTTFHDLKFERHANWHDGIAAKVFFPNGYGASVIRSRNSYGGDDGLYELAVLVGKAGDWQLTYDTPITDDVIGYLTEDRVTELLAQIETLPSKAEAV